jgi:MYXO-CTERM domain-containing protein
MRSLSFPAFTAAVGALGLMAFARPAGALVTEPDGTTVVPIDASQSSDLTCCGNTLQNMSLPALFQFLGESIDYKNDALQEPKYFSPQCGFKGMLILHGGGCLVNFGWYNVSPDPNNPIPPTIYPLVSIADLGSLATFTPKVPTTGTCPDPPACTGNSAWQPVRGSGALDSIRNSPNYQGGYVGFAVQGNTGTNCPQSKYSEPRYNQSTDWGGNWISMVMYRSTRLANTYYVAVEDLPMAPNNFKGFVGQTYMNDGDFNDFVYIVQGIGCPDAGKPCSTGKEGACGLGLTECTTGNATQCVAQMQQSSEVCDNIDNDCNGIVDDKAPCPSGQICFHGTCVSSCSNGEFQCPPGMSCDTTGVCIETKCMGVSCPQSQICVGGQCVGGCDGVVCPEGQVCQLGRCWDPCAGKTCQSGKVCEGGVCLDDCSCRGCPQGRQCANDGHCVLQGCADPSSHAPLVCSPVNGQPQRCGPDGSGNGTCVSVCDGVSCPNGSACDLTTGQCTPTPVKAANGGTGNKLFGDSTGGTSGASDNGIPTNGLGKSSGCSCRTAGRSEGGLAGLLVLGLGLIGWRRRRAA